MMHPVISKLLFSNFVSYISGVKIRVVLFDYFQEKMFL
jgi:hypothetical protein